MKAVKRRNKKRTARDAIANEIKPLLSGTIRRVEVVGCGGTGSLVAEHIARMIAGFGLATSLRLWDGDEVEEANVARQNFAPHEVAANKAHALAVRLAGQFGIPVASQTQHCSGHELVSCYESSTSMPVLLISCVDSLAARAQICNGLPVQRCLWIDCGNEHHTGQAVLGTTHDDKTLRTGFTQWRDKPFANCLPDVAAINPELIAFMARRKKLPKTTDDAPSCADEPFRVQGFGVNAAVALAAATIAKGLLVDGRTSIAQIWLDVAAGRMLPVPVTRQLLEPWNTRSKAK